LKGPQEGLTAVKWEIVAGTHRCIKLKEHFEGLYKAILVENRERHMDRLGGNAPVSLVSHQLRITQHLLSLIIQKVIYE